jgi:hypothetical protein
MPDMLRSFAYFSRHTIEIVPNGKKGDVPRRIAAELGNLNLSLNTLDNVLNTSAS